jgi:hypothetical protein
LRPALSKLDGQVTLRGLTAAQFGGRKTKLGIRLDTVP